MGYDDDIALGQLREQRSTDRAIRDRSNTGDALLLDHDAVERHPALAGVGFNPVSLPPGAFGPRISPNRHCRNPASRLHVNYPTTSAPRSSSRIRVTTRAVKDHFPVRPGDRLLTCSASIDWLCRQRQNITVVRAPS